MSEIKAVAAVTKRSAAEASWHIPNLRRRVSRARSFPHNTCPASRHLHLMALGLLRKSGYPMLQEEPEHCAQTMLAVLESLWKARTELARLKAKL